jgi:predicted tellurium resistance membrane protein TerC
MWQELHHTAARDEAFEEALEGPDGDAVIAGAPRKTLRQAVTQIVIADVSMSLDNVLAVAGAAREHPYILAFGLLLSVALMGVAADLLGRVLQKQRWIGYVGLAIIVYVAFEMIYRGSLELAPVIASL